MPTIAELKAAKDAAHSAYVQATLALNAAIKDAFPIKEGDILMSTDGQLAQVHGLQVNYGTVKVIAYLQKKDGTYGQRVAPLWRNEWSGGSHLRHPVLTRLGPDNAEDRVEMVTPG